MAAPYEPEITFLSGVGADNLVAPVSFGIWGLPVDRPSIPPVYTSPISDIFKWGNSRPGTAAAITYLFNPVSEWTSGEQTAFKSAMALWAAVANVQMQEVGLANQADFQIVRATDGRAVWNNEAYNYPAIGSPTLGSLPRGDARSNISIDTIDYTGDITSFESGKGFATMTLVHELGHMLGLGHGGPYNFNVDRMVQQFGPYDMQLWTLMSYIRPEQSAFYASQYPVTGTQWDGYFPLTPMMLDILAVQRLYGAASSGPLTGGNHTFGFNSNIQGAIASYYNFDVNKHPIVTIWENGHDNALDLSKYSTGSLIDLRPGHFSSANGLKNNIGIAFGVVVETGIGGSGNDGIIASDADSRLFGKAGSDVLLGGAGDDMLSGGADPDTIDGGGGLNVLRDTLSDLYGDTVFHFGQSTTIDVTGAMVGRDHLTVTVGADGDTTLDFGGGSRVELIGSFASGGDFMVVARNNGPVMHTDVTFEPSLPRLAEGVNVGQDAMNGITNQPFLTGDSVVRFTVTLQAAISAFANTLGYYKVATDGTITGVDILFANTKNPGAATVTLATPGSGEQIGFFLMQNGFNQFGTLPHNLSFVAQDSSAAHYDAGQPVFLKSATLGLLNATIFHSFQNLNPNDAIQVLSGVAPGGRDLQVGFEDLPVATGDNDFQDVVINIHTDRDGVLLFG
jgi:serralysin